MQCPYCRALRHPVRARAAPAATLLLLALQEHELHITASFVALKSMCCCRYLQQQLPTGPPLRAALCTSQGQPHVTSAARQGCRARQRLPQHLQFRGGSHFHCPGTHFHCPGTAVCRGDCAAQRSSRRRESELCPAL
jgi:hypothetical protein